MRKLTNQVQRLANQLNLISLGLTILNSRSTKSILVA
jgi:hypothetical protein